MSRISLVRFGTYAIIAVAVLVAKKQRYFIPVHVGINGQPFLRQFDPEDYYHGGNSPTAKPGFADTVLSGSTVLRMAEERLKSEGVSTDQLNYEYSWIDLELADRRLRWKVIWGAKKPPLPDDTMWFEVLIDDKTRETTFERRKA